MSFMLMSPAMLSSPKVDARMKKYAEAEVAAETAARSVTGDPAKSAEAAKNAKQAILSEIEAADAKENAEYESDDEDDGKGVLQSVKEAIVAFDDAVTSRLARMDQKLGFSAAVNKVDDKLKIGDKALAVAKAADENLIRPVVFGVTRAAGAFKRKLVKKKVVVKKKGSISLPKAGSSVAIDITTPVSPTSAAAAAVASPSDATMSHVEDDGQEMKEMTGVRVPPDTDHDHLQDEKGTEDGDESEYEEIEVEEEVEVLEEVSDDEADPHTTTAATTTSDSKFSSPRTATSSATSPATQPRNIQQITSPNSATATATATATSSHSPLASTSTQSTPRQRRKSSTEQTPSR